METLVVNNFTLSGYGDRMLDLLCLIAYARAKRMRLHIRWEDFKGMEDFKDIPSWRFQDTKLEHFLMFFRLPSEVQLSYDGIPNPTHEWRQYLGGVYSPTSFYEQVVSNQLGLTLSEWLEIVDDVKSELKFKVPKYVPERPYVTVHLRRTDKLRGVCATQIVKDELAFLNQETFAAIQTAKDSGYTDFYIATDDPSARDEYVWYIESIGCRVIQPPNTHGLLSSYYDTWMMRSSSLIIPSMRYSTFSMFPSVWWNIPLWTVLSDALHTNAYKFNTTYYKNVQLGN
jgi:hypothetical protein